MRNFKKEHFANHLKKQSVIITDDTVKQLYIDLLPSSIPLLSIPAGEKSKNREIKADLEDQLLERKCGRDTTIVAFGGGVVLDLAGFVAATYCRGVPWIAVPTTLLAMIDASIGGKTAVNTSHGKNLIGAIHPPQEIWVDPSFLESLPEKELRNGLAELLKYACIASMKLFEKVEQGFCTEEMIETCCRIKEKIVEEDLKEGGKRRLLNFGHTIGHALELLFNYELAHGEAVAFGIFIESYLSARMGLLSFTSFERIEKAIKILGFSLELPREIPFDELYEALLLDKKSLAGLPRFVLLDEIGRPATFSEEYCTFVEIELLKECWKCCTLNQVA